MHIIILKFVLIHISEFIYVIKTNSHFIISHLALGHMNFIIKNKTIIRKITLKFNTN